jgi:hypothetical protein
VDGPKEGGGESRKAAAAAAAAAPTCGDQVESSEDESDD